MTTPAPGREETLGDLADRWQVYGEKLAEAEAVAAANGDGERAGIKRAESAVWYRAAARLRDHVAAAPEIRTCYCGTTATVVPGVFPHSDCDGSAPAALAGLAGILARRDYAERELNKSIDETAKLRQLARELIGMAVSGARPLPGAARRLRRIAEEAGIEPPAILTLQERHPPREVNLPTDDEREDGDIDDTEEGILDNLD